MFQDKDWNDYLEPEVEGPQVHCVFSCPKCGFREVVPETDNQRACVPSIICPKCKTKMYEDTES